MDKGHSVKDVQSALDFENPQAIYKSISGRSLPGLDNIVILSRLLHTSIEDILVADGDIFDYGIYKPAIINRQFAVPRFTTGKKKTLRFFLSMVKYHFNGGEFFT